MPKAIDIKLAPYYAKRDFSKTPEPAGNTEATSGQHLVVQQHFARRIHFDLRLEIDGVLVSWAVTRGPSANPRDKRLAVRTEDHPLSYGTFEGLIPKPQYGGGTVMLWEHCTYRPLHGTASEGLAAGHIKFESLGQRLKGAWALVRMKIAEKGENWLLVKDRDGFAETDDSIATRYDTGVLSGLRREQLERGENTPLPKRQPAVKQQLSLPKFIAPQLCGTSDTVPDGNDWAFEMKYDGYRLLLAVADHTARLYTRSGLNWTQKFSKLAEAAQALPVSECLMDGEAVVFTPNGISDFPALVSALESKRTASVVFVVFDLLLLDGQDMRKLSYIERKKRLRQVVSTSDGAIRYADHVESAGESLFKAVTAAGAEGIVAKRKTSTYSSGRNHNWLKIKGQQRADVSIIGYMPSAKHEGFASLLAARESDDGLAFVGRIGTGYNPRNRPILSEMLAGLSPVLPELINAKKLPRGAKYLHTTFGAEVQFAGWTADGQLRQARFLGIQSDRAPGMFVSAHSSTVRSTAAQIPQWHITHTERILFPQDGITKGDIASYYQTMQTLILPHLAERPISLLRVPESIESEMFFQRHPLKGMTQGVKEFGRSGEPYFALDGEDGLAAAVQFGAIEFHGWNAKLPTLDRPDRMVFDLDPDEKLGFDTVKSAAELLRDYLDAAGLETWPLLSGGKGVHVVVPLDCTNSRAEVECFCKLFAKRMEADQPKLFVANMSIAKRQGKIFVDYLRNRNKATAILPWSVRARPGASIAAPVSWNILNRAHSARDYHIANLPDKNHWAGFWAARQKISKEVLKLLAG